jgi:hypothetical protein
LPETQTPLAFEQPNTSTVSGLLGVLQTNGALAFVLGCLVMLLLCGATFGTISIVGLRRRLAAAEQRVASGTES